MTLDNDTLLYHSEEVADVVLDEVHEKVDLVQVHGGLQTNETPMDVSSHTDLKNTLNPIINRVKAREG